MAAGFQVNISISAGVDFTQQFTVNNPDYTPVDITGFKFYANLAKNPTSIDAMTSTSGSRAYQYVAFDTAVVDGPQGVYSITLPAARSSLLAEGKYLYNVVIENTSGEKSPAVAGLAFVDVAFGAFIASETPTPSDPTKPSSEISLQPATRSTLGGVIIGEGIFVTSDGTISVPPADNNYILPAATATTLGGITVGSGLSVTPAGQLNVTASGGSSGSDYVLPKATTTTLGGVIIGTNLSVTTDGTISLSTSPVVSTLQTNSTLTAHTIVTGAENGVAINASAGEITAKWLNVAKNPTTDVNDSNYDVSLRTTGTIITPEANVTTLSGPRQGMIYKLSLGDGLTFRDHASSHIGGTVGATAASGNQYSTNSGTIDLDGVMRTTGTQTLTGDLVVAAGVGGRNGSITCVDVTANDVDAANVETSGNFITAGYYRANKGGNTDVAFETRVGGTITSKIMGGGSLAIGGTIDETATQSNANIFLKDDGTVKIKGGLHLYSANGTEYIVTVSNAGALEVNAA